jgi:hypothetical protein
LVGLLRHRSAFSVSVRTQELYMLVFITRYLDLGASLQYLYLAGDWTYSLLVYNTIGKVLLTERIILTPQLCAQHPCAHTPPARTHARTGRQCGASPGTAVGRVPGHNRCGLTYACNCPRLDKIAPRFHSTRACVTTLLMACARRCCCRSGASATSTMARRTRVRGTA